jgi:hypothetical protein
VVGQRQERASAGWDHLIATHAGQYLAGEPSCPARFPDADAALLREWWL